MPLAQLDYKEIDSIRVRSISPKRIYKQYGYQRLFKFDKNKNS